MIEVLIDGNTYGVHINHTINRVMFKSVLNAIRTQIAGKQNISFETHSFEVFDNESHAYSRIASSYCVIKNLSRIRCLSKQKIIIEIDLTEDNECEEWSANANANSDLNSSAQQLNIDSISLMVNNLKLEDNALNCEQFMNDLFKAMKVNRDMIVESIIVNFGALTTTQLAKYWSRVRNELSVSSRHSVSDEYCERVFDRLRHRLQTNDSVSQLKCKVEEMIGLSIQVFDDCQPMVASIDGSVESCGESDELDDSMRMRGTQTDVSTAEIATNDTTSDLTHNFEDDDDYEYITGEQYMCNLCHTQHDEKILIRKSRKSKDGFN